MSKYHVIHGEVVVGEDEDRTTYRTGESFDMTDADAAPLVEAGTIGKGTKLKEGEEAPTTNPLVGGAAADADAQRQKAAEGAPEGSQDPKAAAKDFRASNKPGR